MGETRRVPALALSLSAIGGVVVWWCGDMGFWR